MGSAYRQFPLLAALVLLLGDGFLDHGASARVIRVPAELPTIQAGLAAAVSGDSVLVAAGTYQEQLSVQTSGITLAAESGQAVVEGNVPVIHVTASFVVIAGFKVIAMSYLSGSPALWLAGDDLRVESCVMSGGWAGVRVTGGSEIVESCICDSETGIQIDGDGSEAVLSGCEIRNNRNLGVAGGVAILEGAHATLMDCRLIDNAVGVNGGAIYMVRGSGAIPVLVAERCVIARNASGRGAALTSLGCSVTLRSCTIVANELHGSLPGAIVHLEGERYLGVRIENCIIAFNKGPALHCLGVRALIECCNIFGNSSDGTCVVNPTDNISLDPLLCNVAAGDFHLESGSPCAPENAPVRCGLIGALDVMCTSAVLPATWGSIKQRFKEASAADPSLPPDAPH